MLPILIEFGFIKVYTYGVFLLLAFFWSAYLLWRNILLTSFSEEEVFDSVLLSIVGGLFIGRLEFVLLRLSDFDWDLLKFILVNGYPGIGLLGFIGGALLFLLIALKRKDIPFSKIIDCLTPALFLGIGIGKLGSFLSGTEIGTKTNFYLNLIYQNIDGRRHLTSLYEAILFFVFSFFAIYILKIIRRDGLSHGFNGYFLLFGVSFVNVFFDGLRSFRAFLPNTSITFDFGLSIILLLTTTIYLFYYFREFIESSLKRFLFKKNNKNIKN